MASRPESIHPNPAPHDRRSPWWAIVIAVSITVGINAVIPYTHHYMHTISLVKGMIPMGILMPSRRQTVLGGGAYLCLVAQFSKAFKG